MVGHITYEVGSVFEKEDCSECICKLGGVSHCTPKHCAPCKEGVTTSIPTTTTEKPSVCPIVQCQPGYKKVIEEPAKKQTGKNVFLSPLLNAPGSTKKKAAYAGIKSAFKTKHPAFARPEARQEVVEELICPQISCEIDKPPSNLKKVKDQCPPAICQPNFIAVYRDNTDPKSKSCPKYSCYPKPPPDAVCYVTGRTFNTFDNTEFKYDICNHVIGRDLDQDEWDVALKKNCSRTCSRDLAIRHDQHEIILRADFSIKYDGYEYTIEQIKNIGAQNKGFSITHLGSILLFTSNRYGFWIVWTSEGNVKFGVVHKLANKVDGLCGYFNNNPEDDKRKPDGSQARTTADFGNSHHSLSANHPESSLHSWALDKEQPVWCESRACPIHIQNKAWEICNKVKEQPLGQCGKDQYLEVDLGIQEPVYGVIIQGSPVYDEYVTSYMVLYSPDDGTNFYYVLNSESPPRPQIFRGSIDPFTPVRQIFSTPFEAKRVRIKPQTWNNAIALRVEIIGCSEEPPTTTPSFEYLTTQLPKVAHCDDEMGLRNGSMVDQQISVSSEASQAVGKIHIRLNSESSWQPLSDSTTEWVQLDFLEPRDITGIVSKGGKKGWVTTYAVKYSHNGKDWNPVVDKHSQNEKTFLGNFDHNSPQVNNFAMPINARQAQRNHSKPLEQFS
ncbi:hypothetical protein HUJ04_006464 [Dendroctonus ponderosae]|nr:hypothetical protein HUJ04_006464 [Dendroctonus ponderosae]